MLSTEILSQFQTLMAEAVASGDPEPNSMVLSTASPDGRVSARAVLLKDCSEQGFVFYTNTHSDKGRQLGANPHACLLFHWKQVRNQVQVRVEGVVEPVTAAEADAYFATRPRGSQIGAWASRQSETLESRQVLLDQIAHFERRFADQAVPRPPHWSGYRVLPELVEFWFGCAHRLHERIRHRYENGQWVKHLLYP